MHQLLGEKKVARIYIDNSDKVDGKLLWERLLREAKAYGIAGATVYKAASGMGAHSQLHTFNVWILSQTLPVIVEMIDDEEKIRGFLEHVEPLIEEGLVTLANVEVIRYKHRKEGA